MLQHIALVLGIVTATLALSGCSDSDSSPPSTPGSDTGSIGDPTVAPDDPTGNGDVVDTGDTGDSDDPLSEGNGDEAEQGDVDVTDIGLGSSAYDGLLGLTGFYPRVTEPMLQSLSYSVQADEVLDVIEYVYALEKQIQSGNSLFTAAENPSDSGGADGGADSGTDDPADSEGPEQASGEDIGETNGENNPDPIDNADGTVERVLNCPDGGTLTASDVSPIETAWAGTYTFDLCLLPTGMFNGSYRVSSFSVTDEGTTTVLLSFEGLQLGVAVYGDTFIAMNGRIEQRLSTAIDTRFRHTYEGFSFFDVTPLPGSEINNLQDLLNFSENGLGWGQNLEYPDTVYEETANADGLTGRSLQIGRPMSVLASPFDTLIRLQLVDNQPLVSTTGDIGYDTGSLQATLVAVGGHRALLNADNGDPASADVTLSNDAGTVTSQRVNWSEELRFDAPRRLTALTALMGDATAVMP